jgi:flagellar biosynthesis/type III secretory pathway protein FliH
VIGVVPGASARFRIPAADIALNETLGHKARALATRARELDEREALLEQRAFEAGAARALEQVRAENAEHAAWLVANTVLLSREILHNVLTSVRAALSTVLADELTLEVTESRVRRLIADMAHSELRLYCSGENYATVESIIDRLREEGEISITLNLDEALVAGDMVIESDAGVIHAAVSNFIDSTTEIIESRFERLLEEEEYGEGDSDTFANDHSDDGCDVDEFGLRISQEVGVDGPQSPATIELDPIAAPDSGRGCVASLAYESEIVLEAQDQAQQRSTLGAHAGVAAAGSMADAAINATSMTSDSAMPNADQHGHEVDESEGEFKVESVRDSEGGHAGDALAPDEHPHELERAAV